MDKIAKLASEHTATRVVAQQTASVAATDPTEKQRKMPRRETPLARIVREGASKTAQEASGSQEAMDAETTPASEAGKAAAPAPEVQNPSWCKVIEEKLEAILAAVNRAVLCMSALFGSSRPPGGALGECLWRLTASAHQLQLWAASGLGGCQLIQGAYEVAKGAKLLVQAYPPPC
ncbi:hypothetical protein HPB48_025887 [Haemaphysalis longicornis]|uniref:Uncharacterized protein n=1 Tax=Haemaphysalis longicornis TaxID=44386 RepID=A0A9J6HAS0_HAELO|nr:hypothetical protein HPB48_025887 [Haemaphysalis longicornis]